MDAEFLRRVALECIAIARECDIGPKQKLYNLVEELLRKVGELEGTTTPSSAARRPSHK